MPKRIYNPIMALRFTAMFTFHIYSWPVRQNLDPYSDISDLWPSLNIKTLPFFFNQKLSNHLIVQSFLRSSRLLEYICTYHQDLWAISAKVDNRTHAIIIRCLYIYYPIFKFHFFVFKEVFLWKFLPYIWLKVN